MSSTAKAKTAKLSALRRVPPSHAAVAAADLSRVPVRTLIDYFSTIPGAQSAQIDCTKDNIEWARGEKRVFLRQNLETKLAGL